jgi:hypothetical protein
MARSWPNLEYFHFHGNAFSSKEGFNRTFATFQGLDYLPVNYQRTVAVDKMQYQLLFLYIINSDPLRYEDLERLSTFLPIIFMRIEWIGTNEGKKMDGLLKYSCTQHTNISRRVYNYINVRNFFPLRTAC